MRRAELAIDTLMTPAGSPPGGLLTWCAAVNADGRYGSWTFAMARRMEDVPYLIETAASLAISRG